MQKHTDPTLAQTQTRDALRLCCHYFGKKPDHVTYEEKRQQAEREMSHNFKFRATDFLASMGFKIRG